MDGDDRKTSDRPKGDNGNEAAGTEKKASGETYKAKSEKGGPGTSGGETYKAKVSAAAGTAGGGGNIDPRHMQDEMAKAGAAAAEKGGGPKEILAAKIERREQIKRDASRNPKKDLPGAKRDADVKRVGEGKKGDRA